jgi:hypothetical protein
VLVKALKSELLTPILSSTTIGHLRSRSRGQRQSEVIVNSGEARFPLCTPGSRGTTDVMRADTSLRNRPTVGEIGSTEVRGVAGSFDPLVSFQPSRGFNFLSTTVNLQLLCVGNRF